MSSSPDDTTSRSTRHGLTALLAVITAVVALLVVFASDGRLAGFALFTVVSHVLIHVLPHEPAVLYVAKYDAAGTIATVGTAACLVAGAIDYWLITKLLLHRRVRPRVTNTRWFRWSTAAFRRMPFRLLFLAAVSPLPFYPVKLLSIADGYPQWRYQAAVAMGRWPRLYLLAWLGDTVRIPNWVLVTVAVVVVVATGVRWLTLRVDSSPQEPTREPRC